MQAIIASTALIRNKVIALKLGADGYGEFSQLLLLFSTLAIIVGFGFELSLTRSVAAANDQSRRQRLLGQSTAVVLGLSGLCAIGVLAVLFLRPELLDRLSLEARPEILLGAGVMILFIPLNTLVAHRVAFLTAVMDIKGMTSARSLALIAGTALSTPIVWFFGLGGAAIQVVLISLVILMFLNRRCRALGYRPWQLVADRSTFRTLAGFGAASLCTGFVAEFADLFVRAQLIENSGAASNGLFQAALSIVKQVSTILFSSIWGYSIARLGNDLTYDNVVGNTSQLISVMAVVGAVAFGLLGLFSGPALLISFSSNFLGAQAVMPFLLVADFAFIVVMVLSNPLIVANRLGLWLSVQLAATASYVVLSLLLIGGLGVIGVAIAHGISVLVNLSIVAVAYVRHGFIMRGPQIIMLCGGACVVGLLSYLGSLAVFDPLLSAVGLVVLAAYVLISVEATVGIRVLVTQVRLKLQTGTAPNPG